MSCRVYRLYRAMHSLHLAHIPVLPNLIRKYMRVAYACDIPCSVELGDSVRFPHNALGVVIHQDARVGDRCVIYQNVTIGGDGRGAAGSSARVPMIGNDVTIYTGAVVIGPVLIGAGATVAANAVVTNSVPSGAVVGGIPAKIIGFKDKSRTA